MTSELKKRVPVDKSLSATATPQSVSRLNSAWMSWARFRETGSLVVRRLKRSSVGPAYQERTIPRNPFFACLMFTVLLAIAVLFIRFDPDLARLARSASADLRAAFAAITDFGKSDWILIPTGIIGLALAALNLRRFARPIRARLANVHGDMCFIFVTIAVTGTSISLIKNTIGRARPKHLDTYGAYAFDVAAFTSDFASFPSGHSTTFGALCACLCLLAPRMMWLWLAFGILGGVSRMMVNAHYASDVLAGLTAGALGTILFARWLSNRNILFRPVRAGHALMPVRKRPWF